MSDQLSVSDFLVAAAEGGSRVEVRTTAGATVVRSYDDLRADAEKVLAGLRSRAIGPGQRLILALDDPGLFLSTLWGCFFGGIVPLPAPPPSRRNRMFAGIDRRLQGILETAPESRIVVSRATHAPELHPAMERILFFEDLVDCDPARDLTPGRGEDTALVMPTSGTTGKPKLVRLTHANIASSVNASIEANGYMSADVSLNWLPLHHIGALMRSIRETRLACRQVQIETGVVSADVLLWLDLMSELRATMSWSPNSAYSSIVARHAGLDRRGLDLSSVRSLHSSGEPVDLRTMSEFAAIMKDHGLARSALHVAWGMTEACFATCAHDYLESGDGRLAEVGAPVSGVETRVVDDSDVECPDGTKGHLQIRGPNVSPGYEDPDVSRGSFTRDGWLRTGDLAILRAGRLTITGRLRDMVKVNGVAWSSVEIESSLACVERILPGMIAATAVAIEGQGEFLAIFFSPRDGFETVETIHEIRVALGREIGVSPRFVIPLAPADFVRSCSGKLVRPALAAIVVADRDRWCRWPYDVRGEVTEPLRDRTGAEETLGKRIAAILSRELALESLPIDANLFHHGATSLQIAQASIALGDLVVDRPCTLADLFHAPTPLSLARRLLGSRSRDAVDAGRRRGVRRRERGVRRMR